MAEGTRVGVEVGVMVGVALGGRVALGVRVGKGVGWGAQEVRRKRTISRNRVSLFIGLPLKFKDGALYHWRDTYTGKHVDTRLVYLYTFYLPTPNRCN